MYDDETELRESDIFVAVLPGSPVLLTIGLVWSHVWPPDSGRGLVIRLGDNQIAVPRRNTKDR